MPKFHTLEKQQTPICFTQFNAVPNATEPGCYSNVLVIQKGIAKGHYAVVCNGSVEHYDPANELHTSLQKYQIVIGDDTLDDVVRCGMEADTVKCKLDHGATVRDIVGNYAGFMRSGEQVRAKLSLMKNSPHRGYVEELFSDFANKVGNSIDFQHAYVIKDNVAVARCVKLNSVDIVDAPAATNSLFNEQENPNQPNTIVHLPMRIAPPPEVLENLPSAAEYAASPIAAASDASAGTLAGVPAATQSITSLAAPSRRVT